MKLSHRSYASIHGGYFECFNTGCGIVVKRRLSIEHGGSSVDDAVVCRKAVCSNHQVS